jgi:ABC-2 type transport system permease protein
MVDLVLKLLDAFRWMFRLLGVDYPKFRLILWAKMTVDNRQEKSVAQRRGKKEMNNAMAWVVFIYVFIGLFMGLMLLGIKSLFVAMFLIFAMVMVMTAVALISDFTSVLLDTTDNAILLPRPVDGRTLAVARLTHIALYMLLISLSLSLATLVIGTVKYGPLFTLGLGIGLVFTVLFVVFLANVFYLLIFKLSRGDHFRDIILYFQIFIAAFAMGSYQLLPRMMQMDALLNFHIPIRWWTFLVPPAWMASVVDLVVHADFSGGKAGLAFLGILVPLVCLVVVVRYLAPGFNRAISRLELAGGSDRERKDGVHREGPRLMVLLSRLWTRNPQERSVFQLCWKVTSQDRKFKLKTYPTFGYMLIIGLILVVFTGDASPLETIRGIPLTQKYIVFLYLGCLLIPIVLLQQRFSDQYEAVWIFRTLPFDHPGRIQMGGLKAMVAKYGLTVYLFLSLLVLAVWGPSTIDDIVLGFINMILASIVLAFPVRGDLPFSKKYGIAKDAQKGITGFLLVLIPAAAGLVHFGLTFVPYGTLAGIALSLTLVFIGLRLYGRVGWAQINP